MWDLLVPRLEQGGVFASRLALSGHEEDSEALATTPWTAWLDDMRAGVAELRGRADRVCLIGYSMGATIGLHALAEHLVDAAVLISPSVRVSPAQRAVVAALTALRVPSLPRQLVGTGDTVGPPLPVSALATNIAFKDHARELELRGPAPTLLLAGADDSVADPDSATEVLRKFGAGTRLVTLAGGEHSLPDGPLAGQVADLVSTFVAEADSV